MHMSWQHVASVSDENHIYTHTYTFICTIASSHPRNISPILFYMENTHDFGFMGIHANPIMQIVDITT
jgi:hypothetical protein